jgi:hypothetical protein
MHQAVQPQASQNAWPHDISHVVGITCAQPRAVPGDVPAGAAGWGDRLERSSRADLLPGAGATAEQDAESNICDPLPQIRVLRQRRLRRV